MNFSKKLKIYIVVSIFWTVFSLLVASSLTPNGATFTFSLTYILTLTSPIWLLWSSVWIWGTKNINRIFATCLIIFTCVFSYMRFKNAQEEARVREEWKASLEKSEKEMEKFKKHHTFDEFLAIARDADKQQEAAKEEK